MFDLSIVESDTHCLLQFVCSIDNQLPFLQFLEKQSEETVLSSVEVDSGEAVIYRVWRDSRLLGKFHRDITNGLWISQPCNYKLIPRFETSNDAVLFIVEMNALAAA
ncbi:MAG: hypothetical protein AAFV71_22345 [Cyanobacteria bacterium J06633_8]